MDDLISRSKAIRWVKAECNPYGQPTLDYESGIKVIEHLERMSSAQPWIPTSEKFPDVGHNILISTIYGSVGEGEYKGIDGYHHKWIQYRWSATWWDDEVIAWKPMPKEYK